MRKLFILILLAGLLASCGINSDMGGNMPISVDNGPTAGNVAVSDGSNKEALQNLINEVNISSVNVESISSNKHFTCMDPELINELLNQIGNQKYAGAEKLTEATHRAEFCDRDGRQVLVMDFGYNVIAVDRDAAIGHAAFKKGVYEAAETPWSSFSLYLDQLEEGYVMEPVNIKMPASIELPEQYCEPQIMDKGSNRLNKYEVCSMMHDFVDKFIAGQKFAITDCKRYYDYEKMQKDRLDTLNRNQCLVIEYHSSDTRLEINTDSDLKGLAMAGSVTLAKLADKSGEYALITDKMLFEIKPEEEFNRSFDELFVKNSGVLEEVGPAGIKELFDNNMPHYMDYICKNLGISDWTGREPNRLEIKKMKLDLHAEPFTVVHIYNPFDLSLLIYKPENDGSFSFEGDIPFGGRNAGTEYELIRSKEEVWIKGSNCKGYGTGLSMYYADWYHVTEDGVQLALSYPIDAYMDGPYGGYSVSAAEAVKNKAKDMRVQVAYEVAKRYYLFLDIADEYGAIELKGKKKVEFVWNSEKGIFEATVTEGGYGSISSKAGSKGDIIDGDIGINKSNGTDIDEGEDGKGIFDINADCPEIDLQCDAMLKEQYEQLSDIIASLAAEGSERLWRANGIMAFLLDCSDNMYKEDLLKQLYEICPEVQE